MAFEAGSTSLAELIDQVATEQTPESILQRVADLACAVLETCAAASVTVVDRGRPRTVVYSEDVALQLDLAQYEFARGPCLLALVQSKAVLSSSEDRRWPAFADAARQHGIQRSLSVPLAVDDLTLGALNLYSRATGGLTGDDDQATASLLARQAAAAVATAQALGTERTAALTLQRSLLPDRLPDIGGYQLAARYLPASSRVEVGGDWYDVLRLDDGAFAAAVGDVAGHGIEAAAVMAQLRAGLRAYILEGHDPASCLTLLSRLAEATEGDADPVLATACLAVIDPVSGACRVASAGHLPPAVRDAGGIVHFLTGPGGPPLGVASIEALEVVSARLEPGSALVLFTDGLVEERHRPLDEGLAELVTVLSGCSGSADELCDRVVAEMFDARLQEDDVAVLVVLRQA
jgi:serine phosphatase RsbU (regulator of sigma subunit)